MNLALLETLAERAGFTAVSANDNLALSLNGLTIFVHAQDRGYGLDAKSKNWGMAATYPLESEACLVAAGLMLRHLFAVGSK